MLKAAETKPNFWPQTSQKSETNQKKSKLKKTSWPRDVGPLVRLLSCNTTKLCQPRQPNWWSHPLVHASVEKLWICRFHPWKRTSNWTAKLNVTLTSPSCSIVEKMLLELVLLVKLSASLSNVFRRRFLRDRNTCPSWLLTLVVLLCGSYSSWHVCCFQKIAWKHKDMFYPGNDKWHSYLLQAPIKKNTPFCMSKMLIAAA